MTDQPKHKVVFLDRDGTINIDYGYVYKRDDWQWVPGAIEGMKMLQKAGYTLTVITNQSGIAHGMYSQQAMHDLHVFMEAELLKEDVHLAAIAFCPHERSQGDCDCRKPKIGMAKQIEEKIGPIDYANSWTIGDKTADFGFGKTAGTKTVLIQSQYWEEEELKEKPDLIVGSLLEAAQKIVTGNG